MKNPATLVSFAILMIALAARTNAAPQEDFAKSLIFHAPFDESCDARIGSDPAIYTSENLERKSIRPGNHISKVTLVKDAGRHGGTLRFADVTDQVLLFKGSNSGYRSKDWNGTVSFWMKVNADQDLKPGYCDPIQMTEKTWNDAAFFVDFDKDLPRAFRLGVFSDYKVWNPKDTAWEQIAAADRPMVVVAQPPFASDRWTHVAFTFENINSSEGSDATATLFLNGVRQGSVKQRPKFSWDVEKTAIMIGIFYIGDFDDLAIFDKALSDKEVEMLFKLPKGVLSLSSPR
ncbi:MAG: LamG domain-containing protein [Planctomycetota bacterium]